VTAPAPVFHEGVNVLLIGTVETGEVPVLLVNDQLAPTEFHERMRLQEAKERSLMADEKRQQFIVGMLPVVTSNSLGGPWPSSCVISKSVSLVINARYSVFARVRSEGSGVRFCWARSSV
jgi:hypothetical protein